MSHQDFVLEALKSLEAREGRWHTAMEVSQELGDYWQRNSCFTQTSEQYTIRILCRMFTAGLVVKKPRIYKIQPKVLFAVAYEFSDFSEPSEVEMGVSS